MDKQFFDDNENRDYELLKDFNSKLNLTNLGRTKYLSTIDASGITSTEDIAMIELKYRNYDIAKDGEYKIVNKKGTFTGNTVFIESHKASSLYIASVCLKTIPLYINFFDNGYVVVYNMLKLNHEPVETDERKIYSKGYQSFEMAKRIELSLKDAYIYRKENNEYKLVQSPC